ncbi:hypothetical protein CDAR_222391 [Caerostris darwini]|uniref:Uncharacterized protein n=1 Tax=Caerostris darwini TaxID=1538125 RepID=A0AAV4SWA5_9ARAC|nr:hypothetical protein CDAR_222391 [Caerostris darwini]
MKFQLLQRTLTKKTKYTSTIFRISKQPDENSAIGIVSGTTISSSPNINNEICKTRTTASKPKKRKTAFAFLKRENKTEASGQEVNVTQKGLGTQARHQL